MKLNVLHYLLRLKNIVQHFMKLDSKLVIVILLKFKIEDAIGFEPFSYEVARKIEN
jgi:hypothetical protein